MATSQSALAGVAPAPADVGRALVSRLQSHTESNPHFWDFERNDKRSHGHALFSYPAMMVPQLQGTLLDDLQAADPTVRTCYDAFGGSGTVLTECMSRGMNFVGGDLNPLAVLIMTVKARPLSKETLTTAVGQVIAQASADRAAADINFRGSDKWFKTDVLRKLCALRRAIRDYPGRDTRRFLWVCLAGTVRQVSNSRTSTFKLHAHALDRLETWSPNVLTTFEKSARANIAQISEQSEFLAQQGTLKRGRYTGETIVRHADVRDLTHWPDTQTADVLMTSPPYGDNRTTVPYGQHAFLPLMLIDQQDLPAVHSVDALLGSPYRIDVASLGGRRPKSLDKTQAALSERSMAVAKTAQSLAARPGDGRERFLSFAADLADAIEAITPRLRPGAVQFWTLGNRRISGLLIPTTQIVAELSLAEGATELTTVRRRIPRGSKRMAARNDTGSTMSTEDILVLQTAASGAGSGRAERATANVGLSA